MPPYRIEWLEDAKADVRRLDRATAMRIFDGILHFALAGKGDVEPLHGEMSGFFPASSWRLSRVVRSGGKCHAYLRRQTSLGGLPLRPPNVLRTECERYASGDRTETARIRWGSKGVQMGITEGSKHAVFAGLKTPKAKLRDGVQVKCNRRDDDAAGVITK